MARNKYFPPGVLDEGGKNNFVASGYEAFLEAINEEALYPVIPKRPATYRILRLSAFRPSSAVRVFWINGGWRVVGKVADGKGGSFPGKLCWSLERTLDLSESEQLEQLLYRLQFWTMSVNDGPFSFGSEMWLIEGVQDDQYHVVQRRTSQKGPILEVGDFLEMVSGVKDHRPDSQIQEPDSQVDERDRKRLEAIHRSNRTARMLAVKLKSDGLRCPHCQKWTREIRFIDKSPHNQSYFICRSCARSFRPEEYKAAIDA